MITVRVALGSPELRAAQVDANTYFMDDHHKAKAAIEAHWRLDNYNGTWCVNPDNRMSRADDIQWDGTVFKCNVDNHQTLVILDFINPVGGPW